MAIKIKNTELAEKAKDIAKNYKTLYIMGCFGAPMNDKNKSRYTSNYAYNKKAERKELINAAEADTFGFDCVGLIKAILWGWSGDAGRTYGGAIYKSNDVPDIGANKMIKVCSDISEDFSSLEKGEALWLEDHIGIYIGDGLAVECSPKWEDKVQITACNCKKQGYNTRTWTKHGKLPYVEYIVEEETPNVSQTETPECPSFELYDIVALKEGVTTYSSGKSIASWVKKAKLYVRKINDNQTITVSTLKEGAITGTLFACDLVLIEKAYNKSENSSNSENDKPTAAEPDMQESDTEQKEGAEKEEVTKPEGTSPESSPLPEKQGDTKSESNSPEASPLPEEQGDTKSEDASPEASPKTSEESEKESESKREIRKLFWRIIRYILDFIKNLLSRE